MIGDSAPVVESRVGKRKLMSEDKVHPGYSEMYDPSLGLRRMFRNDDEELFGDGFGTHHGKIRWEELNRDLSYRDMQLQMVVEGPPGAGKSTFVKMFVDYCRRKGQPSRALLEKPETWCDEEGNSLLDRAAESPFLYSLHMQSCIIVDHGIKAALAAGFKGLLVQDRCVYLCKKLSGINFVSGLLWLPERFSPKL